MECRYNRCSICGFATECEILKALEKQKDINKENVDVVEKLKTFIKEEKKGVNHSDSELDAVLSM